PDLLLTPPAHAALVRTRRAAPPKPRLSERANLQLAAAHMSAPLPPASQVAPRPFRADMPALDAFPYKLWSRLVVRHARHMPASAFTYQEAAGYRPLREAIAAHVTLSRGVHCTPEQIIIVSG